MNKFVVSGVNLSIVSFSLVAILIALILRFSNLNIPFWSDELMVTRVARGLNPETGLISLRESLNHYYSEHMLFPILFNLIVHIWLRLGSSVTWIRLLPNLIGLVGLYYLYQLGRVSGFRLPAVLLAVAITVGAWPFFHYSNEVAAHGLSATATFILIYQLQQYRREQTKASFVWLLLAAVFSTLAGLGNFILLLPTATAVALSQGTRSSKHFWVFLFLSSVLVGYTALDFWKNRAPIALTESYIARMQLNSVPLKEMPQKFLNDNLDYLTYVFGASPWYKDADYFPSVDRFGFSFTVYYYLSLVLIMGLILATYLFQSVSASSRLRELLDKLLPLFFLFAVIGSVNLLSLVGKYPIGPFRQSLFYAPLVIWSLMQLLDLALKRLNLFTLVLIGVVVSLVVNSLTRLIRVPQRHIGLPVIYELKTPQV